MKKLFLIDGHALIFRMYYAFLRRPMINSKGEDMSILYGFMKYLLELIKREEPTHLAVAFDAPGKTFRHEIYEEYKGTRSATPELVKAALKPLIELVESLNIPILMDTRYEADDLIGATAKKWAKNGFEVFMVTPDKDFGQLIEKNIFQYKPGKNGNENEIIGVKEICEKFTISDPINVIDILAIWGDASDNVPGIRGIGEVGAKKLVSKYQTTENILEHLDELPAKQAASFKEGKEQLALSKFLVTIKTDIEISATEEDLLINLCGTEHCKNLFRQYEFPSLIQLLPKSDNNENSEERPKAPLKTFKEVTLTEILKLATEEQNIAISFIGNLVQISTSESIYLSKNFEEIRSILENESVTKIGYNLKEYIKILRKQGISLKGHLADIELMHYLIDPERAHKFDILAKSYLDINIEDYKSVDAAIEEEKAEEFDLFSQIKEPLKDEKQIDSTAPILIPLYKKIKEEFEKSNGLSALYNDIEMPLLRILASMEYDGFKIDIPTLTQFRGELQEQLDKLDKEIKGYAEDDSLNISSPKQLGIILFEKLALDKKAKKSAKGSYSTDEETLLALEDKHPIISKILEYRGIKKLISTYIDPLPELINPETGRLHTTFNQSLTATGRLSSTKPNLQNIPIRTAMGREIRKAFVAGNPEGYILSADYSQIELRIMAALSEDEVMLKAFRENKDIHTSTAAKVFKVNPEEVTKEQRSKAKVANFGIIYGISAFGLSQRLHIPRSEAKELIDEYNIHFPQIFKYIENMKQKALEFGYVETICHRKRYLPGISSRNHVVRSLAERNAVNAPIQGSAADLIKLAMIKVATAIEKEGLKSKMVLQVHDELIFDVLPEEVEQLKTLVTREMENAFKLSVPLTAECNYGKNWLEAH